MPESVAQPEGQGDGSKSGTRGVNRVPLRWTGVVLGLGGVFGLWSAGVIPREADDFFPSFCGAAVLLAWAYLRTSHRGLANRLLLLVVTVSSSLVLADLALRPLLLRRMHYRPHDMFVRAWSRLPLLTRYVRGVDYSGTTFGDLAAMSSDSSLREERPVTFLTDAYGFRNAPGVEAERCDLIVLGDSFGAGLGTAQEGTWTELLRTQYGVRMENLSMPGSPSHGFLNLMTELPRIPAHPGTVVLLVVFAGNDLTESYYAYRSADELPWQTPLAAWLSEAQAFRDRSAIRQLWERWPQASEVEDDGLPPDPPRVIERRFLNGRPMLFYRPYVGMLDPPGEGPLPEEWLGPLRRTLGDLDRFCRERQLDLRVLLVPSKEEVYRWVLEEREAWSTPAYPSRLGRWLEAWCVQQHVPCLDLKPRLVRVSRSVFEASGQTLWWYDDTHWNLSGHAWVARWVHEELLRSALPAPRHAGAPPVSSRAQQP